jgi:hypothetical protein
MIKALITAGVVFFSGLAALPAQADVNGDLNGSSIIWATAATSLRHRPGRDRRPGTSPAALSTSETPSKTSS